MSSGSSVVIGITTYGRDERQRFHLPAEYVDWVRQASAIPVLLPPGETRVADILRMADGVIFAGGGDIAPERYQSAGHPAVSRVDEERDSFEFELAYAVQKSTLPVLGICRGFQLLNVAAGGDLLPHIPDRYGDSVTHVARDGEAVEHEVTMRPESRLGKILGSDRLSIFSKHHQGITVPGENWRIAAQSADGVIEAMENTKHPWMLAVLWHPEMSPDVPAQQRLIRELVEQARAIKEERSRNAIAG